jgi:hypothetical protein
MKLRILDDSIRLRLDRDEVEHLGAGGAVEGATRFPGDSLSIPVEKDLECLAPRDGESRTNRFRNSKARE